MQVATFDVIYLSFPSYLPSPVLSCIVQEYPISLNAIQKNLLSNKSPYFTIYCLLSLFAFAKVPTKGCT